MTRVRFWVGLELDFNPDPNPNLMEINCGVLKFRGKCPAVGERQTHGSHCKDTGENNCISHKVYAQLHPYITASEVSRRTGPWTGVRGTCLQDNFIIAYPRGSQINLVKPAVGIGAVAVSYNAQEKNRLKVSKLFETY